MTYLLELPQLWAVSHMKMICMISAARTCLLAMLIEVQEI